MLKKTLKAAFICFSVSLLLPNFSFACSCMQLSEQQALEKSEVAFVGTVTKVWESKGSHGVGRYTVSFKVERFLKGSFTGPSVVTTATNGAACGYNFQEGTKYKVFARAYEGTYTTGLCSGNTPL